MDIKSLAAISGLTFTVAEFEQLEKDFKKAMEYTAPVLNCNPPDIPIYQKPVNVADLRDDAIKPSLSIEEALKSASKKRGRYFVVPQVVE